MSSILAMLLRMEQCTLTLTKSAQCELGQNLKMSKKVQLFMGLANYYVQYIHNLADIAEPLTSLMSPKWQSIWGAS